MGWHTRSGMIPYLVTHRIAASGIFPANPESNPCIFIGVHPNRV
jgi:hypothetical protein